MKYDSNQDYTLKLEDEFYYDTDPLNKMKALITNNFDTGKYFTISTKREIINIEAFKSLNKQTKPAK